MAACATGLRSGQDAGSGKGFRAFTVRQLFSRARVRQEPEGETEPEDETVPGGERVPEGETVPEGRMEPEGGMSSRAAPSRCPLFSMLTARLVARVESPRAGLSPGAGRRPGARCSPGG